MARKDLSSPRARQMKTTNQVNSAGNILNTSILGLNAFRTQREQASKATRSQGITTGNQATPSRTLMARSKKHATQIVMLAELRIQVLWQKGMLEQQAPIGPKLRASGSTSRVSFSAS